MSSKGGKGRGRGKNKGRSRNSSQGKEILPTAGSSSVREKAGESKTSPHRFHFQDVDTVAVGEKRRSQRKEESSPDVWIGAEGSEISSLDTVTYQLEDMKIKESEGTTVKETQWNEDFPELPIRSHTKEKSSTFSNSRTEVQPNTEGRINKKKRTKKFNDPEIPGSSTTPINLPLQKIKPRKDDLPEKKTSFHADGVLKFPPSPGPGTKGKIIKLIANYYKLNISNELRYIYHYDVDINEVKSEKSKTSATKSTNKDNADNRSRIEKQQQANVSKRFRQEVLAKFINIFKENKRLAKFEPVFDGGKNLFTAQKLPIQDEFSCDIPLEIDGKNRQYMITLKPVKKLDGTNVITMPSPQNWRSYNLDNMNEVLFVLNAVMSYRSANNTEIRVGRSFFSIQNSKRHDVGQGLEIWQGYSQSVHLTGNGPAVVVNLSARVFHKEGEAIKYITELLGRNIIQANKPLTNQDVIKVAKALKGVRVQVTHLRYPRKYYIKGVTKESAQDFRLSIDGKKKSIAQYFGEKYGALKYPQLNCFQMRCSNDRTYVPFEKCEILPGQPKVGGCDDLKKVTNEMIRTTAISPLERFKEIDKYSKEANKRSATGDFQLSMALAQTEVKGRVLEAPVLKYSENIESAPRNGTWGVRKFAYAEEVKSWILLSFVEFAKNLRRNFHKNLGRNSHGDLERIERERRNFLKRLDDFKACLESTCKSRGLPLNNFKGMHLIEKEGQIEHELKRKEVTDSSLVVIVLSKHDSDNNYDEIKFFADFHLGLVTQCVLDDVLYKNANQMANTVSNLCLKINAKLGGRNHELKEPKFLTDDAIIFGADVVHCTHYPSIAAVVGSLDKHVSKYKVCCRVQENEKDNKKSQELIIELEDMVEKILNGFFHYNDKRRIPQKIIFFRDGVSEGQFAAVRDYELKSIKSASKKLFQKFVPITFIVVQKRHQTRLRPANPSDGVGREMNVPPGTTVDTDITYPKAFDYFLCSHEGIRGTSKPSRYTVLHDDNNFSSDSLQKLSYDLCHLSSRCTKSLSIPAPVKYADLAAYRAKKYADFHYRRRKKENGSSATNSDEFGSLPKDACDAINGMDQNKNHMFFI